MPFAAFCWWLADLGARFTGTSNERLPAPALPRGTRCRKAGIFLASLPLSLGLFLWWAHAAPIPPALAWPLMMVASFLPLSAFCGTNLQGILRQMGCRTFVVAGVSSPTVVEATIRIAHDLGLATVMLADACAPAFAFPIASALGSD